jgi:hypothetical protein
VLVSPPVPGRLTASPQGNHAMLRMDFFRVARHVKRAGEVSCLVAIKGMKSTTILHVWFS